MKTIMKTLRQNAWAQWLALGLLMPSLVCLPNSVQANPTNGVVTHGLAEINAETAGHLKILQ